METASPSGWAHFWGVGRWIVGGFILVRLFGQCTGSGTALDDLAIGDCFADPGIGTEVSGIDDIDCTQLHDFEFDGDIVAVSEVIDDASAMWRRVVDPGTPRVC